MKTSRPINRKVAWPRLIGGAALWLALLLWAYHFRMPYDLRIGILLRCAAGTAVAGMGIGLARADRPERRARGANPPWRRLRSASVYGLWTVCLAGLPLFGLLVGGNGALRGAEPFIVNGPIVARQVTYGRGTVYLVTVRDDVLLRSLRFSLEREAFDRTRVGDLYHEEFQRGLFGWPCRPR